MDLIEKLQALKEKFDRVNEQLSDPSVVSNQERLIKLGKERSELLDIVAAYDKYHKCRDNIQDNLELIKSSDDRELIELAEAETAELQQQEASLEEEIKVLLIPKDPNDSKNVIVEIRAGTGGDEAGLFTADLYRMYSRFAERRKWNLELVDINESTTGIIKEVIFNLSGEGVYGDLKFESGVHRVQRVPATEASGRVHTSAASVAIMPEVEDVQVDIAPGDLRIDVFRSGGAGGQNVNKVETAIRITHIPTGMVVQCQDERSQLKNRQKAMKVLMARLYDRKSSQQEGEIAAKRKSMVKSGDRSDKIRTYNYPQNRITDHRIGLTMYNLSGVMEGDLFEIIEKLKLADRTEKLREE